ncbi:Senescence marker protein-30 [Carabus blaptoides fortunei]
MFKIPCFICTTLCLLVVSGHRNDSCDVPDGTKNWGPYLQQVSEPFEHGEEPTWDGRTQLLYFVDLFKGLINSFNPLTSEINSLKLDGDVTPVIPTNTLNKFVVGVNNSVVLLEWNGRNGTAENVTVLTRVDQDKVGNRFNDGKADKYGRLWWGTMGYQNASGVVPDQGSLYRYTKDNVDNPTVEIRPVSISNGLAWSKDNTKFYYIDTPTRKIAVYDFDLEAGNISNKQIAFDLANYDIGGSPDGMTIDDEDNLFIALFGGGAVIKVDPRTGTLLQRMAIPAKQVTSVSFGGKNLDILFVTTSRFGLSEEEHAAQPAAGCLFALTGLRTCGRDAYYADF